MGWFHGCSLTPKCIKLCLLNAESFLDVSHASIKWLKNTSCAIPENKDVLLPNHGTKLEVRNFARMPSSYLIHFTCGPYSDLANGPAHLLWLDSLFLEHDPGTHIAFTCQFSWVFFPCEQGTGPTGPFRLCLRLLLLFLFVFVVTVLKCMGPLFCRISIPPFGFVSHLDPGSKFGAGILQKWYSLVPWMCLLWRHDVGLV